jgi:Zn-dependent protease with chaperone function
VVRHELSHYRHAEGRWSLVQALAFLSPFLVYVYGWPINRAVGDVLTLVLYFLALVAHTQAFRSKRYFERRADRESIRSAAEALVAKQALLKVSTIKRRHSLGVSPEQGQKLVEEFEREATQEPDFSNRLFNQIWGTHPLIHERLATYEKLAQSTEWK